MIHTQVPAVVREHALEVCTRFVGGGFHLNKVVCFPSGFNYSNADRCHSSLQRRWTTRMARALRRSSLVISLDISATQRERYLS